MNDRGKTMEKESLLHKLDRRREETLQLYYNSINAYTDSFDAMALSDAAVEFILETHDLEFYLYYYKKCSESQNLPYHNKYHTYCMVANCYEGSRYLGICVRKALLAAALFHDANHSGGKLTDDLNIKAALEFFEETHAAAVRHGCGMSDKDYLEARDTIKITKYPYEGDPATMFQKIIRDADLMQVLERDPFKLADQFFGLKNEMEVAHKRSYTNDEWADGCLAFQQKVVWHTDWAFQKSFFLNYARKTEFLAELLRKG